MKKSKMYVYEIEYASGILRSNGRQNQLILSNKKLKEEQFIVVEHINCGVFIGRVLKDRTDEDYNLNIIDYKYLQNIDLSKWIDNIERQERLKELTMEMEEKFAEIDKRKKFEYYAQIDEDFKKLYTEYAKLEGQNNNEND